VKRIFLILIIVGSLGFTTQTVFAWNDETTHPALTNNVIDFYNLNSETKITDEEKEWIIKGSIEEDTPPRWINHFYDPVYNEGWTGENGPLNASQELVQKFSDVFLSTEDAISAKNWVHNQTLQTKYKPYKGNQTWERAIYEYVNGNKKEGLSSLGYVLHLLEDMSVPDHTRNDSHPPTDGSPLEDYCEKFTRDNFNIVGDLENQNYKPVILDSLDGYFDYLSNYSNNYFFSKDTINDSKYNKPEVMKESFNLGYGVDKNGLYFSLVFVDRVWNEARLDYDVDYLLLGDDSCHPILQGYWDRLSKEAIVTTAGVIDLFFKEVEKAKDNPKLLQAPPEEEASIFSVLGEIFRFKKTISLAKDAMATTYSLVTTQEKESLVAGLSKPPSTSDVDGKEETISSMSEVQSHSFGVTTSNNLADLTGQVEFVQEQVIETESGEEVDIHLLDIGYPTDPTTSSVPPASGAGSNMIAVPAGAGGGAGAPVVSQQTNLEAELPSEEEEEEEVVEDTVPPEPPVITYPSQMELSQTFITNNVSFVGTAEASSTISQSFSNATTTTNSNGEWSFANAFLLGQGTTTIDFYAMDESGNISQSTTTELFVDSVSPNASLSVQECSSSLSQSSCLVSDTTLNISWESSDTDVDFYEITINGTTSTTTATTTVVSVNDNSINTISLRAKDNAGNYSVAQEIDVEVYSKPIVINEIAWAGTSASYSSDEWIELYNKTSSAIDLSGWVLYSQTDQGPYINLSGQISAGGYYLLERKDEDTVSDIVADLIYGNGGSDWNLNNTGEVLILSNASTTIDQTVLCGIGYYRWCPGFNYKYRTMERIDVNVEGTDSSNWSYNDQIIKNGLDADSLAINGTPKSRNSVSYYIVPQGFSVSSDTTLTKSKSPYFVNNQLLTVNSGVTLTVESGVVIKFYNDEGLSIQGKIIAQGTTAEPIIFTSFEDDEYGGDTNNDATSSSPYPGSWFGVTIDDLAADGSVFDNTIFRYGGKYYTGGACHRSLLTTEGPVIDVSNSIFEYSKIHGLKVSNSDSQITNNIFRNNNSTNDPAGINSSLYIVSGNTTVQNNTFEGNARGMYLADSKSTISSNIFTSNTSDAIYSWGRLGSFTGNTGTNNTVNAIKISGNLTDANNSYSLLPNDLSYFLSDTSSTIVASSTLTIEKDVVVKGNERLNVNGKLIINGENPEDIIFTSLEDDEYGGDTTNNGSSTPQVGQFKGIAISETGELEASGFTMRYAGSTSGGGSDWAGIMLSGSIANISDALFSNNYPYGIRAVNSNNIQIENAKFENHNYNGPWGTKSALVIYQSTTTMTNVTFENNVLGVLSDAVSLFITSAITWLNNTATTSPSGIF